MRNQEEIRAEEWWHREKRKRMRENSSFSRSEQRWIYKQGMERKPKKPEILPEHPSWPRGGQMQETPGSRHMEIQQEPQPRWGSHCGQDMGCGATRAPTALQGVPLSSRAEAQGPFASPSLQEETSPSSSEGVPAPLPGLLNAADVSCHPRITGLIPGRVRAWGIFTGRLFPDPHCQQHILGDVFWLFLLPVLPRPGIPPPQRGHLTYHPLVFREGGLGTTLYPEKAFASSQESSSGSCVRTCWHGFILYLLNWTRLSGHTASRSLQTSSCSWMAQESWALVNSVLSVTRAQLTMVAPRAVSTGVSASAHFEFTFLVLCPSFSFSFGGGLAHPLLSSLPAPSSGTSWFPTHPSHLPLLWAPTQSSRKGTRRRAGAHRGSCFWLGKQLFSEK